MAANASKVVVLAALVVLLGAIVAYRYLTAVEPAPEGIRADELAHIRAAERETDPVRRCLAYPPLPDIRWPAALIEAKCRELGRTTMTWADAQAAIAAGKPDLLDAAMASALEANYAGRDGHGYLEFAYNRLFGSARRDVGELVERWVALAPDDAFALAARGYYEVAAAYQARGDQFAADTPSDRMRAMHAQLEKAQADLEASVARNPRLIAAYHALIHAAQASGDSARIASAAARGLALDPADHRLYTVWLDARRPKWGGTVAELDAIVAEAERHLADNPRLALTRAVESCRHAEAMASLADRRALYREAAGFGPARCALEYGGDFAIRAQDNAEALRYYSQAVRFFDEPDLIASRAYVLWVIGQRDWAMADLDAATARDPRGEWPLWERAWQLHQNGALKESERAYRALLEVNPSHERAAFGLGMLYTTTLPNKEAAAALVKRLLVEHPNSANAWYLKAKLYADGDPASRVALENFLRLVDASDPSQAPAIAEANTRLAALREAH